MSVEIVTKDDLESFGKRLLEDIRGILSAREDNKPVPLVQGFKTRDVRKILGCSVNKLVSLRIARKIRCKKIGGTVYYNREDIYRLLEEGY